LINIESDTKKSGNVFYFNLECFNVEAWGNEVLGLITLVNDLDWLNGELRISLAMLGELGGQDGEDDLAFGEIRSGDLNENVSSVKGDLGAVRVDDWRERQDCSVGVIEDWVNWRVLDDWQELLKFLIFSQDIEELFTIHGFLLLQSLENNVLWWMGFVRDWPSNEVVVMSSHGAKSPSSADIHV
jgi:hypothetical protein